MDTKGFVVLPGQGPVFNMAPGRMATLKLQSGQTGESVMVFEEVAPAGTDTSFHLHHNSDEVACILSGEFTFKIGDQVTVGGPGTCAFMPRGVAHAWKNTGVETGRVLFIYAPAEAGKVFEELTRLQHADSSLRPHDAELRQRYGYERVGPSPF
jgi:mannose-6-phosphate isomerase-like protein (cupin superfamily)